MDPVRHRLSGASQRAVQTGRRPTLRVGGLPSAGERLPHPHVLVPVHPPNSLRLAGDPDFHGWPPGRDHGRADGSPGGATYFDRKEKKKKTSSIWALSLEVEGDDMRKLIADLTENAPLFAETRKLLGSGGKVLEVVEDEQEQAREVAAESYPPSLNGSSATEPAEAASATETTPASAPSNSPGETPPPGNGTRTSGGNGTAKPRACGTPSSPAPNNGNGSSGFNQLRNEFLTAARRVATTKKQAIGEVVEWASGGAFKYGDVGRMTEADSPKLRAATELMASAVTSADR